MTRMIEVIQNVGIVHHDFNFKNIMMKKDGNLVIADFCKSKLVKANKYNHLIFDKHIQSLG